MTSSLRFPAGHPPATKVGDVAAWLERRYPPASAEEWDVVGLAIGSRRAPVTKIAFTVDVTTAILAEAVAAGADMLVAHHPPFLRGLRSLDLDHPKARLAADALTAGVAVYVAHTNADVPPDGVVDALAGTVGLVDRRPLRARPAEAMDKIITFAPAEHVETIIGRLAEAGAGRIGDYDRCAFTSAGQGTFTGGPDTSPFVGQAGRPEQVAETKVEMVLPRGRRADVVRALLSAHPYQTPAFDLFEVAALPSDDVGLGRVGRLPAAMSLAAFAERLAGSLPSTPRGLLVAGDPDRQIRTVAVQAGAGDDLLDAARAAGADVYVTSDLRHHPATEALAWNGAPALVDIPHWAAEWTWLPVVQKLVTAELGVESYVSTILTDAWAWRVP